MLGEIAPPFLDLAYTLSIHKAQGSEFPVILLVITRQHYPMLERNLLSTGMTRARRLLIITGAAQSPGNKKSAIMSPIYPLE